MSDVFFTALGLSLAVTGAATAIPQTRHLLRSRATDGLSVPAQLMITISWTGWALVSISIGAWPKFIAEALPAVLEAISVSVLLVLLRPDARRLAAAVAPVAVLTGAGVAAALMWGRPGAIVALTVFDLIILVPYVRAIGWRRRLSGVSVTARALALVTSVGWCVYSVGIGHPEAATWAFMYAPVNTWVLARVLYDRATHDDTPNGHAAGDTADVGGGPMGSAGPTGPTGVSLHGESVLETPTSGPQP